MHHIIVNPIAGRGRTEKFIPLLEQKFKDNNMPFMTHITQYRNHGYEIAKNITNEGADGIIGMGGDGTFQEIAAGMVDAGIHGEKVTVPLSIFAAGSGNDFIITLEDSKKIAIDKYKKDAQVAVDHVFEKIQKRSLKTIDVITCNGTAFLNIGNMGLDAHIVKNAHDLKPRYGRYAYIAAVYRSIAEHQNLDLHVEVNGEVYDDLFTLVAVCNGRYYGGGLHITPSASLTDGKITLCMVKAMSKAKTMTIFPSLMIEKHTRLKAVSYVECDEVKFTLKEKETLCLDGNLNPKEGVLHFKLLPRVLDVFI